MTKFEMIKRVLEECTDNTELAAMVKGCNNGSILWAYPGNEAAEVVLNAKRFDIAAFAKEYGCTHREVIDELSHVPTGCTHNGCQVSLVLIRLYTL